IVEANQLALLTILPLVVVLLNLDRLGAGPDGVGHGLVAVGNKLRIGQDVAVVVPAVVGQRIQNSPISYLQRQRADAVQTAQLAAERVSVNLVITLRSGRRV